MIKEEKVIRTACYIMNDEDVMAMKMRDADCYYAITYDGNQLPKERQCGACYHSKYKKS